MAWPQSPQPAPAPPRSSGSSLPLGPLVTAAAGFLTFIFSFVQIAKVDDFDTGWSVWTMGFPPGLFGVGTLIPFFALVAAAIALARAVAKGLADTQVLGFSLLQLQLVATFFAVVLWLGYLISVLTAGGGDFDVDFAPGLGLLLLFLGLAGLVAGAVLSLMDQKRATTTGMASAPDGPPSGQWGPPTGPPPHSAPQPQPQQWPQPTPPPAPQPDPAQWQQPAAPPPPPQWQQPGAPAPGQWQPDPAGGQPQPPPQQQTWGPPPGPEQAWQPPAAPSDPYQPQPAPPGPVPEPGPLDPQPAPPTGPQPAGGALIDPGTEVIPGPPPAPPAEDQDQGQGGLPPIPPSNTP